MQKALFGGEMWHWSQRIRETELWFLEDAGNAEPW